LKQDKMTKVLILYATREGQTEKIARRIAETLDAEGHEARLVDADRMTPPELTDFQAVVVGAPIHSGGYPRSIAHFVREHRQLLEKIPSAFVSVGLAVCSRTHDGQAQSRELVDKFLKSTGWHPERVELVAGALPYSKYNFLIRFIMRRISAKEGGDTDTSRDYEYTDWKAVDRFARELVQGAAFARPSSLGAGFAS
jgi:menaquinone-dependent protoporphyrinogen oxidase